MIDDDPDCRAAFVGLLSRAFPNVVVHAFATLAEADAALASGAPAGLLVDERLGEQSGSCWVAFRGRPLARTHVVMCTGHPSDAVSAVTYGGEHGFLVKPARPDDILLFARRALGFRRVPLDEAIAAFARRCAFTPTEAKVVDLSLHGLRREEIAGELRMKPSTAKHHIRQALRKADAEDLQEVMARIVTEAREGTLG